jgi:hypothetical protein
MLKIPVQAGNDKKSVIPKLNFGFHIPFGGNTTEIPDQVRDDNLWEYLYHL